jgi:release factor glutamine methyltransferase
VLVACPPYVPSDAVPLMPPEARDHEPRAALDGGPDGLVVARRIVAAAPGWLRPGGAVVLEAADPQLTPLATAVAEAGLTPETVTDDELGATAVVGRLPAR